MNEPYIHRQNIDPLHPMEPTWQGIISRKIKVMDEERQILYYIPEHAMASTAGVLLLPPSGVSAKDFLDKSNWKMIADTEECKEKLILCVLESVDRPWKMHEPCGDPNGDVAYIRAACADFSRRDLFCVHESKYYRIALSKCHQLVALLGHEVAAQFPYPLSVGDNSMHQRIVFIVDRFEAKTCQKGHRHHQHN